MSKAKRPARPFSMTARHHLVLATLEAVGDWARPMDVGARDRSHHSRTLGDLTGAGFAVRKPRSADAITRGSFVYRVAKKGNDYLRRHKVTKTELLAGIRTRKAGP